MIAFLDRVQDNALKNRNIASVEDGVSGADTKPDPFVDDSMGSGTFWRKYTTLVNREFQLAKRDPALFYLQAFLLVGFGFLVGAAFLRLKYKIDTSIYNVQSSTLWLTMMMVYLQIFKVRHESRRLVFASAFLQHVHSCCEVIHTRSGYVRNDHVILSRS